MPELKSRKNRLARWVSRASSHGLQSGFTLVELSIVIIIVGLLTAGGLAVGASMVERAAYIDTQKLIKQLQRSVKDYYIVYGHLPCVASLDDAPGSEEFGTALEDCSTAGDPPAGSGTFREGSPPVRIGMIPTRTLGLPDSAAQDKYGNRIIYAVTESLTDATLFGGDDGAVIVRDMNDNNILTDAAFYISSSGRDRKGGYSYQTGNIDTDCGTSDNLDVQNCEFSNAIFRDAPFNNGDVDETFFDDLTAWTPKFHLTGMTASSDTLWAANGDENLFSVGTDTNPGDTDVGIGIANPTEGRLHVAGGPIYVDGTWIGKSENVNVAPDIHFDAQGLIAADSNLRFAVDGENAGNGSYLFYKGGLNMADPNTEQMMSLNSTNNHLRLFGSATIGVSNIDTSLSGEGNFQAASPMSDNGYLATPWVYTRAIEADERVNHVTMITLGYGSGFTEDDEIGFVTYGEQRMHINKEGYVGIGTTSPRAGIHSEKAARFVAGNKMAGYPPGSENNAFTGVIRGTGTDTGGLLISVGDNNGDEKAIDVWNEASRTMVFRVHSNGNVYMPYVHGNTTSGAANVRIGAAGRLWRSTSSARYKKNILAYENGLEKTRLLRPVTYQDKRATDDRRYAGFIAEEVDEAGLTEFVTYDEQGRPDALEYSHITALLAKAVQELDAENISLQSENSSLRAQISALDARIDKLEHMPPVAVDSAQDDTTVAGRIPAYSLVIDYRVATVLLLLLGGVVYLLTRPCRNGK